MHHPDVPATATIGYLGPAGTFTEQALLTQPDLAAAQLTPLGSFAEVLLAVAEGDVDYGFVAIENAIEGTVNVTLDTLAFDVDLLVQREVVLDVDMELMARPGTAIGDITSITSFPHAYAQCRRWLRDHLPGVTLVPAASTSEAAAAVAEGGAPGVAALGNARAAEVYGLEILASDIADHPENATRFVLVARTGVPAMTGHDKTSLVVFQHADRPGSLLSILHEFAARSINLTLLLSRPTRTTLGDYCFLVDFEGHVEDEVVADCLRVLKTKQADVKFLGSYPAAGVHGPSRRDDQSESTQAAERWLSGIRSELLR